MRQIGVRDEARLVGGYAPCGQELCCVRFGGEFEPVSIRMAKEQDLPLNSAKISGVCGRLMCCLRYEFEAYRDFKSRAPKRNALVDTPLGKAKVVEYNTPRETVTLRLENGKSFTVALKDMTCSEGCCKRSAEQHAPLRPDTVTREALEALGTPEIVMQLANLDRSLEQGAEPQEARRTPRRRPAVEPAQGEDGAKPRGEGRGRRKAKDASPKPAAEKGREAAPGGADRQEQAAGRTQPRGGGMRPRRTRNGNDQQGDAAKKAAPARPGNRGAAAPTEAGAAQPGRATRRHHSVAGDAAQQGERAAERGAGAVEGGERQSGGRQRQGRGQQGQAGGQGRAQNQGQGQNQGGQRRRHRSATQAEAAPDAAPRERRPRGDAPSGDARPTPRPRRRPGDHGGQGQGGGANEARPNA
jgi:hypothetical protein